MKCKNCGAEIANDSKFCEFCGKKQKRHSRALGIILITLLLLLLLAAIGAIGLDYFLNNYFSNKPAEECIDTTYEQTGDSTILEPVEANNRRFELSPSLN